MKWEALKIFIKKPIYEKFHLIKISAYVAWYRFFILSFSFKKLSKKLGELNTIPLQADSKPETFNLADKIRHVSQVVPWESKCLVQAVVAKILLRKRGIESTLYLGVRKAEDGSSLEAHAWLDVGNQTILGGDVSDQFTVVSSYT
ncbi:MAG: lasso peptide biosynthesis B2 protein [Balneolaceae bacterium]|nr:lasso peptide biosynthesis B2 protein [Balneolaceae bacterium]